MQLSFKPEKETHSFHSFDVDTSGGHIGRYEDVILPFLELLKGEETVCLLQVGMKFPRLDAQEPQHNHKFMAEDLK